jgi:hypothetical protein
MLPEQRVPRAAAKAAPREVLLGGLGLGEGGVQAQQDRQVIRLSGRIEAERPPEPGDPVPGLAAELALSPRIDRRVRPKLEPEQVCVFDAVRIARQLEQAGDPFGLRTWSLRDRRQRTK